MAFAISWIAVCSQQIRVTPVVCAATAVPSACSLGWVACDGSSEWDLLSTYVLSISRPSTWLSGRIVW